MVRVGACRWNWSLAGCTPTTPTSSLFLITTHFRSVGYVDGPPAETCLTGSTRLLVSHSRTDTLMLKPGITTGIMDSEQILTTRSQSVAIGQYRALIGGIHQRNFT